MLDELPPLFASRCSCRIEIVGRIGSGNSLAHKRRHSNGCYFGTMIRIVLDIWDRVYRENPKRNGKVIHQTLMSLHSDAIDKSVLNTFSDVIVSCCATATTLRKESFSAA